VLEIKTVPYAWARPAIRVGDFIGCRGDNFIQTSIQKLRGGLYDMSHAAPVIGDTTSTLPFVVVFDALGKGMRRNRLSKVYERDHGRIFWAPVKNTDEQRLEIVRLAEDLLRKKVKYDFLSTGLAWIRPIFLNVSRLNCSESFWWLQRKVGRAEPRFYDSKIYAWLHELITPSGGRFDDYDRREIAPVPGDCPEWIGATELYELIF